MKQAMIQGLPLAFKPAESKEKQVLQGGHTTTVAEQFARWRTG
jgi:hypothetical protein